MVFKNCFKIYIDQCSDAEMVKLGDNYLTSCRCIRVNKYRQIMSKKSLFTDCLLHKRSNIIVPNFTIKDFNRHPRNEVPSHRLSYHGHSKFD